MKKIIFILALIFSAGLTAQEIKVSGVVRDDAKGTLPAASVLVKDTSNGTTTDADGKYSIMAKIGDILQFSYVGLETKNIKVTGSTVNAVLSESGVALQDVVILGSRSTARTITESAVPIDVISMKDIATQGPQVNLNQILNYVAPSFTSNTTTIADGTDHVDPASLRGLGPDQVLVLVNGKRRHSSSLVNVNGTFGRGSVGTDLNAIPSGAIKKIEILRDGAAAQYGSDAIAGVINIVLKENTGELQLNVTNGANFSKNANEQTGGVDGATTNVSANYGVALGEKGGYINFTGDFDVRQDYNRMKEWEGSIYNKYNTVERFANNDGASLSDLLDDDVADVNTYAAAAGFTPAGSSLTKDELRAILRDDNTTAELAARGQDRTDFNMRVGQSKVRSGRFFANFSLPLDNNGTEIYSFAGLGSRTGNSAGFFRLPNQERTYTPAYIDGFLPEINSTISDQSFAIGIRGKIKDWNVDFSNAWGKNGFDFTIGNTFNASQQGASPTTFDAGGFAFTQNTTNLDVSKHYEEVMSGFNVAYGGEYRLENYEIIAGEESSYTQYTASGQAITLASQVPSKDFFGRNRPGGSQVFPGFGPKNELSRGRNSIAGYLDLEADITEKFLLSFATRFEDYSDFGSTLNFKLASRLKVTDNVNIRGAVNTGFRAPSLHQINFNSTSTIFDNKGNPQEVGTFSNDSRAAKLLGIPQLKEETSRSASLGFTAKIPSAKLTVTVDGYFVAIDDRVAYTGTFSPKTAGGVPVDAANAELAALLTQANASGAAFFANAIDTESKGVDIVISHKINLGENTTLKSDLSGTFSQTNRVGAIKSSQVLKDAGLETTYFNEESRIYLERAVPRTKVNLSNSLTVGKLNVFLRNVYFGEVTEATTTIANQQVFGTKIVTDLSLGYKASDAVTFTVGANNLLDVYPDKADAKFGNRSDGRFDWSRRASQFGIGGRFLFARVSFNLK
ncbi:MAG: iron complex outermembrane receptor protein [Aureispira sp.]|jgi:iron complex outermembrane receptor protein